MNEFLEQFLIESRELIAQAADDLLALEYSPKDTGRFDSLFRAIHTLKGAAGIMDFGAMSRLSHAAEEVLSAVQTDIRTMTPELITDCLACLDQITTWLAAMEASEALPDTAEAEAERMIVRLTPGNVAADTEWPSHVPSPKGLQGSISADAGTKGHTASALAVIASILRQADLPADPGRAAAPNPPGSANNFEAPNDTNGVARPMRTDMARIDALMRLSGELVVAKNALRHEVESAQQAGMPKQHGQNLARICGQFDRLTADLLRASMAARVLPLRQVFQHFPRLVREMAAGLNKKIRLVTEGDTMEVDRLIVGALFEPVLHVLRNAADHGVESTEQREAAGKPVPAIIRLSAARLGEEMVIEIADDGRGIDLAAIRATAEARGIVSPQALAAMSQEELQELIFAPGFSTAGSVSNLSGRGVGMDAVRVAIRGLGGRVAVQSRLGAGTIIRFHLPFTVLLTQVLNVEVGGQIFGIPLAVVVETSRFRPEMTAKLGAAETIFWRSETLLLISLAQVLHLPEAASKEAAQVVIVEHSGTFSALKVDRLGKQIEVMLKPLDGLLAGMPGVAGTALLSDGRVLIVLELQELLN